MLFVAALPAATICCVDKASCETTMQASMPCCAGSCTMTNPKTSHENDATLSVAPSLRIETGPAVVIAAPAINVKVSIVIAANDHQGFSPPPPILLNEQFRI